MLAIVCLVGTQNASRRSQPRSPSSNSGESASGGERAPHDWFVRLRGIPLHSSRDAPRAKDFGQFHVLLGDHAAYACTGSDDLVLLQPLACSSRL